MIRLAENLILLIVGLGLGYLAVWQPPGLLWPVLIGTMSLTARWKVDVRRTSSARLASGLVLASTISLGVFTVYYMGVGLD